jgi:hypothetical protein
VRCRVRIGTRSARFQFHSLCTQFSWGSQLPRGQVLAPRSASLQDDARAWPLGLAMQAHIRGLAGGWIKSLHHKGTVGASEAYCTEGVLALCPLGLLARPFSLHFLKHVLLFFLTPIFTKILLPLSDLELGF